MKDDITAIALAVSLVIYIVLIIQGKQRGRHFLRRCMKCLKYIFVPYKAQGITLVICEVMNGILLFSVIFTKYNVNLFIKAIIILAVYIFNTTIMSIVNFFIEDIGRICQKLEEKEKNEFATIIYMMPIFIIACACQSGTISQEILLKCMRIICLTAFMITYLAFHKILLDFICTNKKDSGIVVLREICFQVVIEILLLFSGAYVLIRMYSDQMIFEGSGWDLLYELTCGFFILDYNFLTETGCFGKVYIILFIVAYIIMFMAYLSCAIDNIVRNGIQKNEESETGNNKNDMVEGSKAKLPEEKSDLCITQKNKGKNSTNMKEFKKIFKKVNGIEILKQYCMAHVILFSLLETAILGLSRKSLEIARLAVDNRIYCKLKKKYKGFISEYQQKEDTKNILHEHVDIVWVCWFQGMEHAPKMVQYCFESLKSNLRDKRIILITEDNYKEYVQFPTYILEKYEKGCFSKTHLSDLLRLELLIKYGGTWIDATVWCSSPIYPDYLFDSDLFMFQNLKPGLDGQCTAVSSWFITSCSNNQMLMLERALLYEYWKENTKIVHYYLFHMFFQMVIEAYPDEWNKVVPFSNATPHILLLRLFEEYDETIANAVKEMTSFHKLTYKFEESDTTIKNTFYQVLFGEQE